jgi:AcrR family transcriptional regulator
VTTFPEAARRLGRPPKDSIVVSTPDRLIAAAFEVCLQRGFDAVTLAEVSARAGITANAVYKHFDSKAALLVATARRALETLPEDDHALPPQDRARALIRAFLDPSAAPVRRFVAELAAAAPRHHDLLELMGHWNHDALAGWPSVTNTEAGRAKVKSLYVLLLGACQLEALSGISTPPGSIVAHIERAAATIFE